MIWYFRSFINVYKGPNMQTMDEKAELVQKLLSWLFGEIQQEREWQNTPDANLQEVQGRFQFMTRPFTQTGTEFSYTYWKLIKGCRP